MLNGEKTALLTVLSVGAIQCVLFVLLILLKKEKKLPDWILVGWFFVFFVHLIISIDRELNHNRTSEILIMSIGFLQGPLLYIYSKTIFYQKLRRLDFIHFLPFILFTISSFGITKDFEAQWEIIVLIAKVISLISYPCFIIYTYPKKRYNLKTYNADHSLLELSWIRVIAILFLLSTGVSLIRFAIELSVGVYYFKLWDLIRYIILITVIGFFGLKYGMVYKPEIAVSTSNVEQKYKNSPLKNDEISSFSAEINDFFKKNKTYLQSDFSLASLAASINIPKHHLSQVINEEMHTTFYDLVNTKRIEYAMLLIKEKNNMHLTLEGLGYECGFNSKSSFFHNFKKYAGKTPGQFKKEISTD